MSLGGVFDQAGGGVQDVVEQGFRSATARSTSRSSSRAHVRRSIAIAASQAALIPAEVDGHFAKSVAFAQRMDPSTSAWTRWRASSVGAQRL